MTNSRLDKLPHEIQLGIIRHLPIQSVMRLYQTSRHWKRIIDNDKRLWRSIYERHFGNDFAKDRWILWAIRRLWSQSSSEEERLAARRVSLTIIEHLDGYTWYRLVYGRMLTMKNWRNNTLQRIIIFPKDQSDMRVYEQPYGCSSPGYGIPFTSDDYDKLGFGIVNDTLSDTQLVSKSNTQTMNVLPLQTHSDNIVFGKIVPIYSAPYTIDFFDHVNSDEFVFARKKINKDYNDPMIMLVWNLGHLEVHNTEHQSYCVPSLYMAELLPHNQWHFLEQQGGWLLIEDMSNYTNKSRHCLLYDIRRRRLAMSFSMGTHMKPIIGKVTSDKAQVYYGHITRTSKYGQYYWHTIEVSVQPNTPTSTIDLTWYDQIPTSEAIETIRAKHRTILECVKDQGYWCDEGYLSSINSASEGIPLISEIRITIRPRHLVDDLFLLAYPNGCFARDDFIMVHSLSQQHLIWSKNEIAFYMLIPEEKAILIYDTDGTVQLLSMYTGDVLNSFDFQGCNHIQHIIGPLFLFMRNMLVDVRTGEIVRTIKSDPVITSLMRSVLLPDMDSDINLDDSSPTRTEYDILDFPGSTRIEYINRGINSALIFEYAQI
jgi:hypothetical protein